jgi:hypothetical protein
MPPVARPLVRHRVDDDHRIAGGVGRGDRVGVRLRPERRLEVAVVEGEGVGVVLRAPASVSITANGLSPAMPFARRIAVYVLPLPLRRPGR